MDCGKDYILMCEKAYPIIGSKILEEGDYWYLYDEREDKKEVFLITGYPTDSGIYGPGISEKGDMDGWIPLCPVYRQDQLQAMCQPISTDELIRRFFEWYHVWFMSQTVVIACHTSMEQLWLAFVMKEQRNKTRDGNDWIDDR